MSMTELVREIRRISNAEHLTLIETATALVREDLNTQAARRREDTAQRIRSAALEAKELYEPGRELAEWTILDGEEVLDDSVGGHINHAVKG
ncbi:MAG TPA: hypothetical protein VK797_13970 [Tepidisphaeraceae bacterium]|jgi:hypothetical protein|nr:hypothetical protein [Tepidisphaeraceae bacterium]